MSSSYAPSLTIEENVKLQKYRELPVSGRVLVRVGDVVNESTIVAEALLPGDLHILRLPEKMGLEPFEVLKGLKVKEGDVLQQGQLICEHSGLFGLFKSRFFAPYSGEVEFITQATGHMALRLPANKLDLNAYIPGVVKQVLEGRGALIESQVALVQGIFGVGGERSGLLQIVELKGSYAPRESDFPGNLAGSVIVADVKPSSELLEFLGQKKIAALVCGSIDDRALRAFLGYDLGVAITGDEEVPFSLILTEGFGDLRISKRTLELLRRYQGQKVSINGATQVRAGAIRPEIIIPRNGISAIATNPASREFKIGQAVRIVRVPYFGTLGHVIAVPKEPRLLPTGAEARGIVVKLDSSGEDVFVPRANLEIV